MKWSIFVSLLSAGIVYISGIMIAALISRFLGAEQISHWAIINSVIGLLPVLEFGVGSALFSSLVTLKGRNILDLYNRIFQLLRFFVVAQFLIFSIGSILFIIDIKWDLNIVGNKYYIYILFLIAPLFVFVSIVEKVHASRNNWSKVKGIDGVSTAIVTVVLYVYSGMYSFTIISVVLIRYVLIVCIKLAIYWPYVFNIKRRFAAYRDKQKNWLQITWPEMKSYFAMSFVGAFAISSDTVLIAIFCSSSDVAEYYAAQRVFLPVSMFFGIISPILWYKFSKIIIEKNGLMKLRIIFLKLAIVVIVIATFVGVVILLNLDLITSKWLGDSVSISSSMSLGHFIWMITLSYGSLLSPIANSMSLHKLMSGLSFLMLLANLVMTVLGLIYFDASAAVYASIFSTLFIISVPLTIMIFSNNSDSIN